jgi:hypothetical protein
MLLDSISTWSVASPPPTDGVKREVKERERERERERENNFIVRPGERKSQLY